MRSLVTRHPVLSYFALAFAVSWSLWAPRIASAQAWWTRDVPEWWHYAGAAGPVSAAVIVSFVAYGAEGPRRLLAQFRPGLANPAWLAFVVASVGLPFAVALGIVRVSEGAWPAYADIAKAGNLPALGLPLTFLIHTLTFGIGEETGWRAFALPHLQESRTAGRATALLFGGWALWHVPSFFENPSFLEMGAGGLFGWVVGLALGAAFLTWLYNSTGGSMVTVLLWHGLFNTVTASAAAPGVIAAAVSTGVMVLGVAALALAGPAELRGLSRHAGTRVRWRDLA